MINFATRLRQLRRERDMTLEDLAKQLDVSYVTISRYESGQREPKFDMAMRIAEILNVNIDYLLGLSEPKQKNTVSNATISNNEVFRIPVLGKISAGLPVMAIENIEDYAFVSKELVKPHYEYFYLTVNGDSMNLLMQDGARVLIQRQDTIQNGEIAVVMINGYDAVIKKVIIQDNILQLLPMSTNSEHIPQIYDMSKVEAKIIGKATFVGYKI